MAAITICGDFEAPQNKVWHYFHVSPSICHEVMGPDAMILVFWMLSFKPTFSLSSFKDEQLITVFKVRVYTDTAYANSSKVPGIFFLFN